MALHFIAAEAGTRTGGFFTRVNAAALMVALTVAKTPSICVPALMAIQCSAILALFRSNNCKCLLGEANAYPINTQYLMRVCPQEEPTKAWNQQTRLVHDSLARLHH